MTKPKAQSRSAGAPAPTLWIEVDTGALAANLRAARVALTNSAGHSPQIMAVVKAGGYGHGAAIAASAFIAAGADSLAVTTFDEAAELVGANLPGGPTILIFCPPVASDMADFAAANDLTMTVCDSAGVRLAAAAAAKADRTAKVHLKVDTGMGRFGLAPDAAFEAAQLIAQTPSLELTGVYTHFGQALSPDPGPTRAALAQFNAFTDRLEAAGIEHGVRHCAASAAALRLPESRLDMVRLGTVLYGQYPAHTLPKVPGLSPATWKMRARVAFVHELPAGATVGYGAEYRAKSARRVAVLPVGFADGFGSAPTSLMRGMRGLKAFAAQMRGASQPYVTFDGTRAPVLGRIAMQTVVVDVTAITPPVEAASVAEIPMRRLAARSSIPRIPSSAPGVETPG